MTAQAYRTSAEISGVWFLEESDLQELDSKIEAHFAALKKMRQRDIADAVRHQQKRLRDNGVEEEDIKVQLEEFKKNEKDRYPHSQECRTVTIKANEKELAVCRSFADAITGTDLLAAKPTTFKVKLQAGQNTTEISLIDGFAGNRIDVSAQPDGPATAAFLVEIERWAEAHRIERFLQWWHRQWMWWMFGVCIPFLVIAAIVDSKETSYSGLNAARAEARTLIDHGVTDSNRDQAMTVLLRLLSDNGPTITRRYSHWWSFGTIVLFTVLFVVIAMPPTSIIGVGRGKNAVYWRKNWYWFWTRFIPFGVVGSISLKVLVHLISNNLISK
ncbi:MAG: hypothetical protein AABP62_22970 [Planctomycetota bacterium]